MKSIDSEGKTWYRMGPEIAGGCAHHWIPNYKDSNSGEVLCAEILEIKDLAQGALDANFLLEVLPQTRRTTAKCAANIETIQVVAYNLGKQVNQN